MSQAMRKHIPLEWVEREEDHWTVRSASDPRQRYRVVQDYPGHWTCACPAFSAWRQGEDCKHLLAVFTKIAVEQAVAAVKRDGDDQEAFTRFIEEVEKEWKGHR